MAQSTLLSQAEDMATEATPPPDDSAAGESEQEHAAAADPPASSTSATPPADPPPSGGETAPPPSDPPSSGAETATPLSDPPPTSGGTASPPTDPPPAAQSAAGPPSFEHAVQNLSHLRRVSAGPQRQIAGVAGGLGRHFNVDPLLFRILFFVLTFFGGFGLICYVALWVLVPEDSQAPDEAPVLSDTTRTVLIILIGIVALVSLIDLVDSGNDSDLTSLLFLAGAAVAAWMLFSQRETNRVHAAYLAGSRETESADSAQNVPAGAYPPGARPDYRPGSPAANRPDYRPGATSQMPYQGPPIRPRPAPDPRRRGPILFWLTLALMALAIGSVSAFHLSGADVLWATYPAVALGIVGVMLVIGAWYGRAGGLIALGLILVPVLIGASAAERVADHDVTYEPTSVAEATRGSYDFAGGDRTVDLSQLDPEDLAGERIDINQGFGSLKVIVPEGSTVDLTLAAGIAEGELFGEDLTETEDVVIDRRFATETESGDLTPVMSLDIELGIGEVEVTRDAN